MKIAYLCPGQGAQHVGMGADLCAEYEVARRTFQEADDALGFGLTKLCQDGPEDALTLTENTQPALLTMSVAIGRVLADAGVRPTIAAGHSLGEWSAWVLVGALDFTQAVDAVRKRGQFMQQAVAPGVGAMSAVLGTDLEAVTAMCEAASDGDAEIVVPANLNGGGQIVVAGHAPAVARLEEAAAAEKKRVSRLKVSAPFHSPLMAPAADQLVPVLDALQVSTPDAPVVTNVEAKPLSEPAPIAELLRQQITAPVRWEECGKAIADAADVAIEVGPGRVLAGLMRRIERSLKCHPTGDVEGIKKTLEEVSK